jgi:hypothetical protein
VGVGIYGNATNSGTFPNTLNPGNDEIGDNATNGWQFVQNSTTAFTVKSTGIGASVPVSITAAGTGLGVTNSASIGGALLVTGALTPSQTNGIVGTTTNNNANAGSVGEYITNSTSGTSMTSLSAGDWDVGCVASFVPAGGTTVTSAALGVSTTSATQGALGAYVISNPTTPAGVGPTLASPVTRVLLSTASNVYCVANSGFGGSTQTINGFIRARRIR